MTSTLSTIREKVIITNGDGGTAGIGTACIGGGTSNISDGNPGF
jgi:hypothetical protein